MDKLHHKIEIYNNRDIPYRVFNMIFWLGNSYSVLLSINVTERRQTRSECFSYIRIMLCLAFPLFSCATGLYDMIKVFLPFYFNPLVLRIWQENEQRN